MTSRRQALDGTTHPNRASTHPTFGLCHDFRQRLPFGQDHATFYAECLAEIEAGDALGYDTVWLSEHHYADDGMLSAVFPVAAAIAARTRRIRIGTN
ncbi:MAG TPA: LLM class flavin-dependent oxidoreductase, partial [Actinopolymorphaceae bacterium]|nr:LLM class flavin-dependent oxidoreductase [Actinopolymorphaceae bacterium]